VGWRREGLDHDVHAFLNPIGKGALDEFSVGVDNVKL
jgi:hypothetical protein